MYNVYRKLIPQVLAEASALTNPDDVVRYLRANNTLTLRALLTYILDTRFRFDVAVPSYKVSQLPEGHHISTLFVEGRRLYVFTAGNKTPMRRKTEILRQILEIMDPKESQLIEDIITRTAASKYPSLSVDLVNKAFPKLIPVAKTANGAL